MIEVVYRKENMDDDYKDSGFKLPKNIKQIGGGDSDIQVYMEDNVALYLSKVPDRDEDIRYGVLVGSVKRSCGYTYIFINGAVDVREVFDNTVIFSDDIWTTLNDDIYRYFPGKKVVGWFLSQCYSNNNQNIWIKKMHLNNFAGMDKVFFEIEREEDEEGFYYYGKDRMEKLPCYHIYYEKNQLMKEYMEDSGMDIHFRKATGKESRTGTVTKVSEKKIEEKVLQENNEKNIENNIENEDTYGNIKKYNNILSRVATFFIIGALAVTVGIMGKDGKFNNLIGEFKSMVNGIMADNDEPADGNGIISVNGTPSANKNVHTEQDTTLESTEMNTVTQEETLPVSQQETTLNNATDEGEETSGEDVTGAELESDAEQQTTTPEIQTASVTPVSTTNYMVEKGETLYSICMKLYGNTNNIETIMELNDLDSPDSIYYGKNLIVP